LEPSNQNVDAHAGKKKGGYGRPPLDYFLTSPGAGVGLGAPELSFSAGILWDPADPVVGDGFAFVPPVEPFGLRSTAPLLPPACSSICLVVPWALAADIPAISAAVATRVVMVFIFVPVWLFEHLAASRDVLPWNWRRAESSRQPKVASRPQRQALRHGIVPVSQ
jgi:hypothetical protein